MYMYMCTHSPVVKVYSTIEVRRGCYKIGFEAEDSWPCFLKYRIHILVEWTLIELCIHFFFLGSLNGHCTLSVRFGPCIVLKKLDRFGAKGLMLWTAPFNEEPSCLHWQIVPGVNQSPEACLLQFPNNLSVCSLRIFLICLKVKSRPLQF